MKKNNLKSWQPGVSGNPRGRPKGSRNIKKVIQDLLNDPNAARKLALRLPRDTETPLEAIVHTLMVKAIRGDVRASEILLKHSVDKDKSAEEPYGFFDSRPKTITFQVLDTKGNDISSEVFHSEETGQLGTVKPEPEPTAVLGVR